jgi:hypothetical protein
MARTSSAIRQRGETLNHRHDLARVVSQLNNQLGILLANAELLESKCENAHDRRRATVVVASALEAMAAARELGLRVDDLADPPASRFEIQFLPAS